MLATYSSEKSIDSVRDRNLAEIDKNSSGGKSAWRKPQEEEETRRRQGVLQGQAAARGAEGAGRRQRKGNRAQQATIGAKTKEKEEVRIRFAEEKKRYLELTGKKPADAAGAAPAALPLAATPAPAPAAAPAVAPADKPAAPPAAQAGRKEVISRRVFSAASH
ncbi:MAG: hypothetical protein IPN05_17375 [Sulfuritalea sp.]|nr:hypothetical protein [Sulfuritalea sp.]